MIYTDGNLLLEFNEPLQGFLGFIGDSKGELGTEFVLEFRFLSQ